MLIEKSIAPPLPTLRPTKPTSSATFPVYQDLEALLAEEEQQPDQQPPAHTLAVAAGYAYSDAATVSMMLARMGCRAIIACRWTCPWTRCSSGPPPT